MNEERLNPYFDINAKYEDMILRGKSIVEHYLSVSDGDGEAPDYICLAYDVKNYLPKLQQENQQLKEQLHQASLDIHELIERDIECPSNCDKLVELMKRINKAIEIAESYNLGKYDYSIPPWGIIELLDELKGNDNA